MEILKIKRSNFDIPMLRFIKKNKNKPSVVKSKIEIFWMFKESKFM